jgi:DNA-binding IclR family transcriptional regulator
VPTSLESPSTAVDRAVTILEVAAERRDGLTNSEISRKLQIPKSSASYILRTLERRGFLRRDRETGRYRLGLKVLSLGRDVLAGLNIGEVAQPFIASLVERVHMTAHLAVLDHGEAVYVEKVEAPGFFKVNTWVGRRMFVHSTSVGKVLVAWMPRQEVEDILREKGLKKRTPRTIGGHGKFFAELERVRLQGYAVDDEENSLGARCVAAPVFDLLGRVEFALGVSGTVSQMDDDTLPRVVEHLKDTARRLSRQIQRVGPGGPG